MVVYEETKHQENPSVVEICDSGNHYVPCGYIYSKQHSSDTGFLSLTPESTPYMRYFVNNIHAVFQECSS